jgi:hypothetical protein
MAEIAGELRRNATSLSHLRHVVELLTTEDLARSLGAGWTVTTALGHLAFWDTRQLATIRHHIETGAPLGDGGPPALEDSDDIVNVAVAALANAADPERMRIEVLRAAEAINQFLEDTDPALLAPIADGAHAYLVRRWQHREEHLEQIESGLG